MGGESVSMRPCVCLCLCFLLVCVTVWGIWAGINYLIIKEASHVPNIELASMDFTLFNITETSLTAKWDLSIRIPDDLPGSYICLQGDFQASFLYKNFTLATSSPQKYSNLKYHTSQTLTVSAVVSGKDIGGLDGKEKFMEDIKEKRKLQFVSQFFLTDCRKGKSVVMGYVCNEANLLFEPAGSQMKASMFGKHPKCIHH